MLIRGKPDPPPVVMIFVILPPTHLLFALQVQKVNFNLHFFTRNLSLSLRKLAPTFCKSL